MLYDESKVGRLVHPEARVILSNHLALETQIADVIGFLKLDLEHRGCVSVQIP